MGRKLIFIYPRFLKSVSNSSSARSFNTSSMARCQSRVPVSVMDSIQAEGAKSVKIATGTKPQTPGNSVVFHGFATKSTLKNETLVECISQMAERIDLKFGTQTTFAKNFRPCKIY